MDPTTLIETLHELVPGAVFEALPSVDCPTVAVPGDHIVETCRVLRDAPGFGFAFLSELTAVDLAPREPRYAVVYHLVRLGTGHPEAAGRLPPARLRLKVPVPGADPSVPTVSGVFPSANWSEREVFDLFGIVFTGHPDLRRLLLPDEWEGHPLRKDYPVQVRVPVRTTEAVQLTQEQFVANIERQRVATGPAGPAKAD